MRKPSVCVLIFAALLGVTAAAPAFASGSFSGRPPQPPAEPGAATKLDREQYGLGQKIYDGDVMTPGGGEVGPQKVRLLALQAKLPGDAAKTKNLVALAGKLSASQLAALEYFVAQRFAMKK